jgi:Animal haem peroxidase
MSHHPMPPTPTRGNVGQAEPVLQPSDQDGVWRPRSKRTGIGPYTYVWWNSFYALMEYFNRKLARDPNRQVSWDKWPSSLGLLYLLAKIRFNRSNALTDPYDYKSRDNNPPGTKQPDSAKTGIAADGQWVSDERNGKMGASMTRYSSNIAPRKTRPDVENMKPSARDVAKDLRWRRLDSHGEEITIPALILNVMAQSWIQFQFHGFGGNTMRDPINENPYRIKRDPSEGWPNNEAVVDRTSQDPTRVGYDGRPTPINEKVHAWVQGHMYGNNEAEMRRLRTNDGYGAKMVLDDEGLLPEDPSRPGVDLTGFSSNYNPYLSFLHWLFAKEHNAIVDYMRSFHPDWDEETLFQSARKINCAQIARIHTVEWTEDLLQHPTLQLGMHADWYGFLGQRLKCWLMRVCDRQPIINFLLKPIRDYDVVWGMPGSRWTHHDGPFQVPQQFRLVYRLHEMLLGESEVVDPESGHLLERIDLINFVHHHTRQHVKRFGYDTLGWTFVRKSCGALTLHNFPRALTQFARMQDDNLIDLAELDIFREREDGTGTYNDLRQSLGEPPVTSFMELTGGNAEMAKEIEAAYHGDINKVDAGIGILAEPRPAGFVLGFIQFYQFVLNAPRRVKSNRFLSEGYTYKEYLEGMNWVEHAGGFKGAIRRHLPVLATKLEGVKRGFAPWPESENFPERLLFEAQNDIGQALRADLFTLLAGIGAGALAVSYGLIPGWAVFAVILGGLALSVAMATTRLLSRRFLQVCEKKCNTDNRRSMFGIFYRSERSIRIASTVGRCTSTAIILFALWAIYTVCLTTHPWMSAFFLLTAVKALSIRHWANAFNDKVITLKVALRNRMRAGQPMSEHAPTKPFGADEAREVDRLFRTYAPGRDYLTVYDFGRMYEKERAKGVAGRGRGWSRKILCDYADMIVEEDRNLVPAISREMYVRVLKGIAKQDLEQEKRHLEPVW